jgi:HIT zinc finger
MSTLSIRLGQSTNVKSNTKPRIVEVQSSDIFGADEVETETEGWTTDEIAFVKPSGSNPVLCSVCKTCEGRYTCPKCHVPFCSRVCYQSHSSGESNCTEAFFQDRVQKVLDREVKEKRHETQTMLFRIHQDQQLLQHQGETSGGGLCEQELIRLLQAIEVNDSNQIEQMTQEPKFQRALHNSMQSGELSEWIVDPWYPWWRSLVVPTKESTNDGDSPDSVVPASQLLDERLINVPKFATLYPKASIQCYPDLQANLVDILYSIVWTLRLFHGLPNCLETIRDSVLASSDESVSNQDNAVISTLLWASCVLSQDARYTDIEESLTTLTAASTSALQSRPAYHQVGCNTPWNVLAEDVAVVCGNRRTVARALLEGSDVCFESIKVSRAMSTPLLSPNRQELRRILKKLEFYASWVIDRNNTSLDLNVVSSRIRSYIETWKRKA